MTQVNYLKTVMSWNEYACYIRTKIFKQLYAGAKCDRSSSYMLVHKVVKQLHAGTQGNQAVICWRTRWSSSYMMAHKVIKQLYAGAQGDRLLKCLTKKLKRIISKPFTLKTFTKHLKWAIAIVIQRTEFQII